METVHILFLIIIIPAFVIQVIGIIRKRGWDNYRKEMTQYYVDNNRNMISVYSFMLKAAFGKYKDK